MCVGFFWVYLQFWSNSSPILKNQLPALYTKFHDPKYDPNTNTKYPKHIIYIE